MIVNATRVFLTAVIFISRKLYIFFDDLVVNNFVVIIMQKMVNSKIIGG